MDDDTLTNYLNDARLNQAEYTMLENLNNTILLKCKNNMRKLKYAIDKVEESINQNHLLDAQEIRWLGNYFDICTQLSIDYEQVNEHKNCYNREFEL